MEILRVENIGKKFGEKQVLKDINFNVLENEFFFILGPSGCGKTTLLRIIAGFVPPDNGKIFLKGKDITKYPPNKRNMGFVFQNYALWPHMTVKENIAYGLKIRNYSPEIIEKRVKEIIEITKLNGLENLYPAQISGGQQQRTALARALIVDPQILLLDEPLSNLDAKLREELRSEIKRIHRETEKTMIYVTHDQKEAMSLATRIAVMENGEIVQIGSPFEIYKNPANLFVASFIGEINILKGKILEKKGEILKIETNQGHFIANSSKEFDSENVFLCFRPESISPWEKINSIKGKIKEYEYTGEIIKLHILSEKRNLFKIVCNPEEIQKYKINGEVGFSIKPDKFIILEE